MFLFLIKKTFFDWWDHLGSILLINLGYLGVLCVAVYVPSPAPPLHIVSLVFYFVKFSLFFVYTAGVNRIIKKFTDFSSASFVDVLSSIKAGWLAGVLFSFFVSGLVLILFITIDQLKTTTGLKAVFGFGFLFWLIVLCSACLPFFYAFEAQGNNSFIACIKKSIFLMMDNPIFSIGLLTGSLIIFGLSLFLLFLMPGLGGLLLWYNVALRLRIKKYDYLEKIPGTKSRTIPWKELLKDDMDRLSSRTLKGLIFPWKEK